MRNTIINVTQKIAYEIMNTILKNPNFKRRQAGNYWSDEK